MLLLLLSLAAPPDFEPQLLGVDLHESCAIGDVDLDGRPDVVSGRNWYRSGEWVARPLRSIEDRNGYSMSNSDHLLDVDADGDLDLLAGNYFDGRVTWHENPGAGRVLDGSLWTEHLLADTGQTSNELNMLLDLDSDGTPEWVASQWVAGKPMLVWTLDHDASGRITGLTRRTLSDPDDGRLATGRGDGLGNGHAAGVGDLSGDGLTDLVVGTGWYEQPADGPWSGPWTFHADFRQEMSLPVLVDDYSGDGRPDLLFGVPHDYGVRLLVGGDAGFESRLIDGSFSQAHVVHLADVDSDGQDELVTGKRVRAHNGKDPGASDQPQVVYFELDDLEAGPRVIERGRVGVGLKIESEDLDQDGDVDLVVAGKGGLFILWNGGRP